MNEDLKDKRNSPEQTRASVPSGRPVPPTKPITANVAPAKPAVAGAAPAKPAVAGAAPVKPAAPTPGPVKPLTPPIQASRPVSATAAPACEVGTPAKPATAPAATAKPPITSTTPPRPANPPAAQGRTAGQGSAPAKPAKATGQLTTIEAKIDVGFGNQLYLRGQGGGLSWFTGVPLTCIDRGTWRWTSRSNEAVTFKLLLNDAVWAQGQDLVVAAGQKVEVIPVF